MRVRGMRFAVAVLVGMLLLAGCGGEEQKAEEESPKAAESPKETPETSSPSPYPTAQGEAQLKVSLSGANEVPRPGDTAMSGSGTVTLSANEGTACPSLNISVPANQEISAAHIHRGAQGANGPIVVPFEVDPKSVKSDCVTEDKNLIREIMDNPSGFYVNVHTRRFPDGATRGQLTK
jgi:hypothetical protein